MRLLLDENLPHRLRTTLPQHEVFTVSYMGWTGVKNGALLKLMTQNGFDALITFDQNIEYQQNFSKYSITVFILVAKDNSYLTLAPLMPKVADMLSLQMQGPIVITA